MKNSQVYNVKRPSLITWLLYIGFLMVLQIFTLSRIYRFGDKSSFVVTSTVVIFFFICMIILIYRMFTVKRYVEIQIKPDSILIGDTIVEAKSIKTLYIRGYFKPLVGVRPKAKFSVPYKLCFSFLRQDQEDKGMKELTKWAEDNQIKVLHRNFSIWI